MKTTTFALAALTPALLLAGCYTTSTYSREVEPGYARRPAWSRQGEIVSIREIVHRTQGEPVGGAIAGGLIGGLLGHAITGEGGGALVGAVGGAATGAAVSQGSSERRTYEVEVRFDDGSVGRIAYAAPPPWHTGDRVRQTARGLEWVGRGARQQVEPPRTPPPSSPPPPPPTQLPPPPEQPAHQDAPPAAPPA
jgi:outer membrane lipoprotein SlyB